MSRLVFLLEERSMQVLLDGLLPRLFPDLPFLCIPHEGKKDLEQSVPRKLKGWREPGVRFVVLRDNDGWDCHALKKRLTTICRNAGRGDALVRIACQELEGWYFGDPNALAEAFGDDRLRGIGRKKQYRLPDAVQRPSAEIKKLVPEFQKVSGARLMATRMSRERNTSRSFQVLMQGVERSAAAIPRSCAPNQSVLADGDDD